MNTLFYQKYIFGNSLISSASSSNASSSIPKAFIFFPFHFLTHNRTPPQVQDPNIFLSSSDIAWLACLHSPTKGWLTAEIAATTHAYYAHIHFGKKSSIRSRFSKCSKGGGGYDIGGLEKWHLLPFPRHASSSCPSSSSSSFYRKPLFPTFVTCFWAGETVLVHIMATKIKRIEMKNLQTQQFAQKKFS